jgi:hypothetical protein
MNSSELVVQFRSDMDDKELPYLWSDDDVFGYANDAQKEFCRKTDGIEDSRTTSVCRIEIVPGTEWYANSPLILHTREASRIDTGRVVPVGSLEKARALGLVFDGAAGPLRALVDGQSKGFWRATPLPNETVSVQLSVFRLPLAVINADSQALEIDDQHHPHLVLWMRHRAYLKQDADAFDPKGSAEYQAAFWAYCAVAKQEQGRARRGPGLVAYGGI